MTVKPVRFSFDDAQAASDAVGFNCGPAALAAVAGLMPDQAIDALPGFVEKRYTNPLMMKQALAALKISFTRVYECVGQGVPCNAIWPTFGLARIQWGGPWMKAGVPIAARYRHTHWIAVNEETRFDVNAMCVGGWLPRAEWETQLVPWLLRECEPKANGEWWPTHCWQIAP
jgi:hypothetical protein